MDVNERIKKQLDTYPVLLYMKGTPDFPQCGFSAKTVGVLRAAGAALVLGRGRERRCLHEIEVVEHADPDDAGHHV